MFRKILFIAFIVSAFAGKLVAQDLISAADLAKETKNPDYVIVAADLETEYAKVHITNAVNISYKSFFKPGAIEGLLISTAEMEKIFGEKGVSENKTIVVYDEGASKYSTRVYWILKHLGATKVKVLDGGLAAWKAGRKPVTKNPTNITPANFKAKANAKMIVEAEAVTAAKGKGNTVLVDCREEKEFKALDGKSKGHIPWAINVDHSTLLKADHTFKTKAELEKIFTAAGVTKDKTVILYCSTGVRTGKAYLALTSILGYPNVVVYDNGLNEWEAKKNPVEK